MSNPAVPWPGSPKNVSLFGSDVWPGIANIKTSEKLYLIDNSIF